MSLKILYEKIINSIEYNEETMHRESETFYSKTEHNKSAPTSAFAPDCKRVASYKTKNN